jgi:hypothetical protein
LRKDDFHDPPPCPGVIIEEMLDSASTHGDHPMERKLEVLFDSYFDKFTKSTILIRRLRKKVFSGNVKIVQTLVGFFN